MWFSFFVISTFLSLCHRVPLCSCRVAVVLRSSHPLSGFLVVNLWKGVGSPKVTEAHLWCVSSYYLFFFSFFFCSSLIKASKQKIKPLSIPFLVASYHLFFERCDRGVLIFQPPPFFFFFCTNVGGPRSTNVLTFTNSPTKKLMSKFRTRTKKKKKNSGAHSRVATLIQPSFQKKQNINYSSHEKLVEFSGNARGRERGKKKGVGWGWVVCCVFFCMGRFEKK